MRYIPLEEVYKQSLEMDLPLTKTKLRRYMRTGNMKAYKYKSRWYVSGREVQLWFFYYIRDGLKITRIKNKKKPYVRRIKKSFI